MKKKGQMMGVLMPIVMVVIILIVIAIVMSVGQQMLSDTRDEAYASEATTATCNVSSGISTGCTTYGVNSTKYMQSGLGKISDKFPLIGTVVVLVIVIGLLFGVFMYVQGGRT